MKILWVVKKSLRENLRDWKILSFSVFFAPFVLVVMYFYFSNTRLETGIIVVNQDEPGITGEKKQSTAGQQLIRRFLEEKGNFGNFRIRIHTEDRLRDALEKLKEGDVQVVVKIPRGFSQALENHPAKAGQQPVAVKTYGDHSDYRYILGAAYCDFLAAELVARKTGQNSPVQFEAVPVGRDIRLNDFDRYLPAMLIFSIINLLFTSGGTIIREKDRKTLIRLRLSTLRYRQWITGVGLSQIMLGIVAFLLTYGTARVLGYQPTGGLVSAAIIIIVTSVGIIAVSLMVSAFIHSVFDLMTIGVFPYFILLFFSGGMIPLPPLKLIQIGETTVMVNEILPTTHALDALEKVLNQGAGLVDILPQLGILTCLTAVILIAGGWLFVRRHLRN